MILLINKQFFLKFWLYLMILKEMFSTIFSLFIWLYCLFISGTNFIAERPKNFANEAFRKTMQSNALWFFNLVRVHKQLLFKPILWSYNTCKVKLLLLLIFKSMASYGYYLYFLKPVANFLNVKLKIQSSYESKDFLLSFIKLCRKNICLTKI